MAIRGSEENRVFISDFFVTSHALGVAKQSTRVRIAPITKEGLEDARQRGEASYARGAASAYLDGGRLMLMMRNGAIAGVEVSAIPCNLIASAPLEKLRNVEVSPLGDYVWFPEIDEGFSVPALLDLSFGAAIRSRLGKLGGPKSTPAKVVASRKNGRKGGRPRKKTMVVL